MPPKRQPRRQPRRGAPKKDSPERDTAGQPATEENAASALVSHDEPAEIEQLSVVDNARSEQIDAAEDVLPSETQFPHSAQTASSMEKPSAPKSRATETPTRRPVQRLASLRNQSQIGGESTLQDASAVRPASFKFQPKSVQRRSKEEREVAERAEAERLQARLSGTAISVDAKRGAFLPRGRGRGNIRGSSDRLSGAGASGHLGGSTRYDETTRPARRRGGLGGLGGGESGGGTPSVSRGRGGGRGGSPNVGQEITRPGAIKGTAKSTRKKDPAVKSEVNKDSDVVMGKTNSKKKIKKELSLTYGISSSESEYDGRKGRRINIEEINLISSDSDANDEAMGEKGQDLAKTPKAKNPRPVRFHRDAHVERAVGVNTDPTTLTSAELRRRAKEKQDAQGSMFIDSEDEVIVPDTKAKGRGKTKDVEFIEDKRKWKGVYQDDDDMEGLRKVKAEPEDDHAMILSEAPSGPIVQPAGEVPSINVQEVESEIRAASHDVEMTDRLNSSIAHAASSQSLEGEESQPLSPDTASRAKEPRRKHRPPKPVLQTDEDHQEWARFEDDLSWMHGTLLEAGGTVKSYTGTKVTEHDDDMDLDIGSIGYNAHAGSIFLFQFPPVLPMLVEARSKKQGGTKTETKKEGTTSRPVQAPTPSIEVPAPTQIPIPSDPSKMPPPSKPAKSKPPLKDAKTSSSAPSVPVPPPLPQTFTPISPDPPPGQFGTLRLHRSKRVTANWGTLQFDVGRSSERHVAQELVVCDWNKTVVKKEGFDSVGAGAVGGSGGGSGGNIKGEDGEGGIKAEERGEWREEVQCGEKVWALGGVQGGWVGVPDLGEMFGV